MSFELVKDQEVQISIRYEHSQMVEVSTNSPFIEHFLRKVHLSQAEHTWINYAHDLKVCSFAPWLCLCWLLRLSVLKSANFCL